METLVSKHRTTNDWAAVRRQLHRYPELSGREKETSASIARHLETWLPDRMIRGIAGTGILAIFEGTTPGPMTWFRAELDALPIRESDRPYRSTKPDVAHLCGHDGHMTILLRLAELLHQDPVTRGSVGLLFQPAEETGLGAEKFIRSPKIRKLHPERIFALHNLPGYPKGQVVLRPGPFTSSVISLAIHLSGKTAHAAEPDKAVNPGGLIQKIWNKAQKLNVTDPGDPAYAIVTPVHYRLGTVDYGITPGNGEIHLTIRTRTESRLQQICKDLTRFAQRKAEKQGIGVSISTLQHFPAVVNDAELIREMDRTCHEMGIDSIEKDHPFAWGEDFSRYLEKTPGALIVWGAGEDSAPLHHPDYDFPDDQIEPAARFFHQLSKKYHG